MRSNPYVFVFLFLFAAAAATADTIQNFVIVTASNMSLGGGTFNIGGGTFSGTFSVDISDLPNDLAAMKYLPAVDLTISAPGIGLPDSTLTSGVIGYGGPVSVGGVTLGIYSIGAGTEIDGHFIMYFVQVPGTFTGGQIYRASVGSLSGNLVDTSGDAVAIDPAFLAPEPWTAATCVFSLLAIGLYRRRGFLADWARA